MELAREYGANAVTQVRTGGRRCIGRPKRVMWSLHAYWSSTAPAWQPRPRTGRRRCTGHPGPVEHGAEATAQAKNVWTPLHRVTLWCHIELARLLVEHGADATIQDKGGLTLLHGASRRGHVELARFLAEHGTEVQPSRLNILDTHSSEDPPSEK